MKLPIESPSLFWNNKVDGRSRRKRGNARAFRLGLEALEPRTVLSTFALQVFDDGVPVAGTTIPNGSTSLTFIGSSAHFASDLVVGVTNSPGTPNGALLLLNPQSQVQATTTGTHTLTLELTSTDFSLPSGSPIILSASAGGEYQGGGSVNATYQTFLDPTDTAFGQPAGSATPLQTASASGTNSLVYSPGTATATIARPNPLFSLTSVATFVINASGGDLVNLGATTIATPPAVATPAINTQQQPPTATVGSSIADTATVTGGNNPTGTVTFNLYNNPNGTGTPLFTDTEPLVNGVATSAGYTTTATGTDYWIATYNGDNNNTSVSSGLTDEPVSVTFQNITISGTKFNDLTGNGFSSDDTPLGGVTINLYQGTSATGTPIQSAVTSVGNPGQGPAGTYSFTNVAPGTYFVQEAVPPGSTETGGQAGYVIVVGGTGIPSGGSSTGNNFDDFINTPVGAGEFATIGFWQNKNGQAVIQSFANTVTSTGQTLGGWLASSFPNLFGTSNPYISASLTADNVTSGGLSSLSAAQIAAVYKNLWNPSGVTKNTYVQAFAVALGMFSTTSTLGGTTLVGDGLAAKYGFNVTTPGGANATFKIGGNSAAFGGQTGSLTVFQILVIVDQNFDPTTGLFYGGDQSKTSAANNVLNGINTKGDIS